MADKANYYRTALLTHIQGGAVLPQPAQLYVALSTTDPGSDLGNLTEPPGANGYARQPVTLTPGAGGVLENDALVRFGPNTNVDWGTITHAVIMDAATGGNGWMVDALVTPRPVTVGNPLDFEAGALQWDET